MKLLPHHAAVIVRDVDSSLNFYEKLGFREVYRHESAEPRLTLVNLMLEGWLLELIWYPQNQNKDRLSMTSSKEKSIGLEHFGLRTSDIKATLAEFKQLGLASPDTTIVEGRTEVKYFFIQDPDGVRVEIVEDKRF